MHITERIFNALHTQNFVPINLGLLKENTSKTKWKYFKITLISFEIKGMHMYNKHKSVEK
jgi:hypothetical protein